MKSTKPAYNSRRKKVVQKSKTDYMSKSLRHGETVLPVGDEDAKVLLPPADNTHAFEIIKTKDLTSNLQVACPDRGHLVGLRLNVENGSLTIDPFVDDARRITLDPNMSNGSWIEMLSQENDWFCWGWTGGELLKMNQSPIFIAPVRTPADRDGDGAENILEQILNSNPDLPDSDGDGVIDGIEIELGSDPTDPDSQIDLGQDSDGDGTPDFQEVLEGTDHLNPGSKPGGNLGNIPSPSEIGPVFISVPNNLVIEAGTSEVDAKAQALIGAVADDNIDPSTTVEVEFFDYTGNAGDSFTAVYSATDSDGNTTTVIKTFTIADTVAPVITISEASPYQLLVGQAPALAPSATADTGELVTSDWDQNALNNLAVGETATITYTATDASGNVGTATLTIEIIEEAVNTAPVITGVPETFTVERGTSIAAFEASIQALIDNDTINANDAEDGIDVGVTFTHDYTDALAHDATFTVTFNSGPDSEGLSAVPVVKSNYLVQDTIAPVITLDGDNPLTVTEGSVGTDPGATTDDGSPVTSDWSITDQTVPGTYTITYNSVDAAGNNATPVTRSVEVAAATGVIPENLTIDADLFANTVEKSYEGIATMMDLDNKILSFNGSSALTFYNGYKYDPQPVTTSEVPDAPGSSTTRTIGDTTGARTYSIWVRRADKGVGLGDHLNAQMLFWKGGNQGTSITEEKGWWIGLNTVNLQVQNESSGQSITATVSGWNDGEPETGPFKHVVVVWTADGVGSRVYINGNLAATDDLGVIETSGDETNIDSYHGDSTVSGNQQVLRIGSDTAGLFGFMGALAWPSIYHGELSESQITDLYNYQNPILTAAVTEIYYRASNIVEDDFFNSQEQEIIGTLTANPNNSQIQTFDGSSYIRFFEGYKYDIIASPALEVPFNSFNKAIYTSISELARAKTYSTWFNADNASAATTQYLMAKGDDSTRGWAFFIENGTINFRTQLPSAQPTISHTPAQPLNSGVWYHVSVVVNTNADNTGGDSRMYLNGQLVETGPFLGSVQTGIYSGSQVETYYNGRNTESFNYNFIKLRIGAAYTAAGLFSGKIAYPAIHIGELSAPEIQALYDAQNTAISEAEANVISAGLVVDDALFLSPEKVNYGAAAPVVDQADNNVYTFSGNGGLSFYHGFKYDPHQFSHIASTIASWSSDAFGRPGKTFDYYGRARTYSIWFNANDASTGNSAVQAIFSKYGSYPNSQTFQGWRIYLQSGTVSMTSNTQTTETVTYDPVANGDATLSSSSWYHLVIIRGESDSKIYINGQLVETGSAFVESHTANSTASTVEDLTASDFWGLNSNAANWQNPLVIGGVESGAVNWFTGKLGYPAIYVGELSPEQIDGIYNEQLPFINALP